jgi:threonine synthase
VFVVRGTTLDFSGLSADVEVGYDTYEAAVDACAKWAATHGWLDATPGGELAADYLKGFSPTATEIVASLGEVPGAVICPVGNGTTLSSIHTGFERLGTDLIPRHYGVTVRCNPFVSAGKSVTPSDWESEPLRSARPLDMRTTQHAVSMSAGRFVAVTRGGLLRSARHLVIDEGLACHPASAAAIAGLDQLRRTGDILPDELLVAIVTTRDRPDACCPLKGRTW